MSKYSDAPNLNGQKYSNTSSDNNGAKCWAVACAKAGHPEAANVAFSGAQDDQHDKRKTLRRAINAITAKLDPNDFDDDTSSALHHAGQLIARFSAEIDRRESLVPTSNSSMKALRNAADFAKHYKTNEQFGHGDDGEIGIADFLRGVANLQTTPAVRNALTVGTDTAGGFSVPGVLMPGILSALVPVSSLLQAGTGIIPMDTGGKNFTTAAVNAIPTAAWRLESGTLATSDPTFRAVVATPRSLSFQFKISRELLADGQGLTEALYTAIAASFARELDRVGLLGTGTAPEPRGVLNTSGIQAVANGANGAVLANYSTLFSAMQAILQADAPTPTAAIMSPRSLVKLGGLVDSTGQPMRMPGMLENVKLIGTSQISNALTVGTSTDCSQIFVGDFSSTFFALRENVSIQVLNELYAGTGEIGFACHLRADFVSRYPAALAVITGVR